MENPIKMHDLGVPPFSEIHLQGINEEYHCHNDPYIRYGYKIKCMFVRLLQPIAFDHH